MCSKRKIITNPAWEAATYELSDMIDGRVVLSSMRRTSAVPPKDFKNAQELMEWFIKNEVPRYIEVES